ncbi:MAG: hypothetical protein H0W61_16480 [Bacteroidetes bacterium]|nr:hypothetical protein [Bacteroidota bacterium]
MVFKIKDEVKWAFGEGSNYTVIATSEIPYERINKELVYPESHSNYVIVQISNADQDIDSLPFYHVPEAHLELIKSYPEKTK